MGDMGPPADNLAVRILLFNPSGNLDLLIEIPGIAGHEQKIRTGYLFRQGRYGLYPAEGFFPDIVIPDSLAELSKGAQKPIGIGSKLNHIQG